MSAEELGRLSQNQRHLLDNVRRTSRQRADRFVRRARLSSAQQAQLERARTRLADARIVVNTDLLRVPFGDLSIIDSLIEFEKLYNIFELELAARDINPQIIRTRLMSEFKLYGATPDVQTVIARMSNAEHPGYGSVDYIEDPIALSATAYYGWHRLRLKADIEQRCTFTPADSIAVRRNQVFTLEDVDGVLVHKAGTPARYWFEYVNDRIEPFSAGAVWYIEAQILGGVWLQDIDRIYYPGTQRFDREFFAKLQRLHEERGIELIGY